jgi:hypothetical protein
VNDPDDVIVDVSAEKPEVELSKFVGTAGYYIVLDDTTPKSLPSAAIDAAEFAQTKGAEASGKLPINFEITKIGFMEAAPAGVLVHAEGEKEKAKAKYIAFKWDATNAEKATADVTLADWTKVTVRDVESYVCPDYTTMPELEDAVKLTEAVKVKTGANPKVTVGTPEFVAADYELSVMVTSDADVHEEQDVDYTIAVFDLAIDGAELFSQDVKASLDKTAKTVKIDLNQAKFLGKSSLHLDILQKPKGGDALSVVEPVGRVAVTFAAKTEIAAEKDEDDLIFTITLDKDLTEPLTKTKFVFDEKEKDVAEVTGNKKKFTVTIAIADVLKAESTTGYVKGDALLTSTLPFALFTVNPALTLKHTNATHAEATFTPPEAAGTKIMIKSGDTTAELTLTAQHKCDIAYEKLADAVVYYTDADDVLCSNKLDITLPEFTAPEYEWVLAAEDDDDKTPKVKLVFEEENANRVLIVPGTTDVTITLEDEETTFELGQLVQTAAYYIVAVDDEPKTLPLAVAAATLAQEKATEKDGKVQVTVTIEAGLLEAVPTGILVHATGEEDAEKMEYYPFTWSTEEGKANEATAEVVVATFKDLTAKNIESYVANKVDEEAPTKIEAAEMIVVIKKKEPVEPEPKDEGAFGQMVSMMAVVLSVFVLAL